MASAALGLIGERATRRLRVGVDAGSDGFRRLLCPAGRAGRSHGHKTHKEDEGGAHAARANGKILHGSVFRFDFRDRSAGGNQLVQELHCRIERWPIGDRQWRAPGCVHLVEFRAMIGKELDDL